MTKANVEAAVSAGAEKLSRRAGVTAERILEELKCIGFLDPIAIFREDGSLKPITDWDESARRALSGCDVTELSSEEDVLAYLRKVRFWDKKGALELLGKHLAMWTERVRHDGEVRFRFVDPGEAEDAEAWAEEGDE